VAGGIIEWVAFLAADFQQRPQLWHKVEVPKLGLRSGSWQELDQTGQLRHRRDAFFTLSFPNLDAKEPLHFFYEADRHRTNTHKYNKKLRAHFHFVVKQKRHQRSTASIGCAPC
jgi:hypothetical protein